MSAKRESQIAEVNETSMQLVGSREIVIQRTFNAPARVVFDAWTRPELVTKWWAPASHGVVMVSCEANVEAGGRYRYVMRIPSGERMAFSGRYLEVTPPSRLVFSQVFEPTAGGASDTADAITVTVTFTEDEGRTHLVSHTVCPTAELRDAIIATGMESGMRETMDQLEALVAAGA